MCDLQTLLNASAARHHNHLCPRQVLGVRMGLYAAELFDLDLPQNDKRLFAFVETDGCLIDGIAVATGCWVGNRTMRVMDYGKTAATFVDTHTDRAIRVTPTRDSRMRARDYAPDAPDRWHAQLAAYQVMPTEELLLAQEVTLNVSLAAIVSRHGGRVVCERCGEDIMNEREVRVDSQTLCRACGLSSYYEPLDSPLVSLYQQNGFTPSVLEQWRRLPRRRWSGMGARPARMCDALLGGDKPRPYGCVALFV